MEQIESWSTKDADDVNATIASEAKMVKSICTNTLTLTDLLTYYFSFCYFEQLNQRYDDLSIDTRKKYDKILRQKVSPSLTEPINHD